MTPNTEQNPAQRTTGRSARVVHVRRDRQRFGVAALLAVVFLSSACGEDETTASHSPQPSAAEQSGSDQTEADALAASRNAPIPTFSNPTDITNEYFPLSALGGYELVGDEEGKGYEARIEVMPDSKRVDWAGGATDVLIARHRSYLEGELIEEAIDYYAQADDGSVWYFGEDVTYFENGTVTNHEGSWLTGKDGALPGLLIPASPEVGFEFWSEDFPAGDIQERNEIVDVGATVDTPAGARNDGLKVRAFFDDGTTEEKVYVPGLGVVHEAGPTSELRLV